MLQTLFHEFSRACGCSKRGVKPPSGEPNGDETVARPLSGAPRPFSLASSPPPIGCVRGQPGAERDFQAVARFDFTRFFFSEGKPRRAMAATSWAFACS